MVFCGKAMNTETKSTVTILQAQRLTYYPRGLPEVPTVPSTLFRLGQVWSLDVVGGGLPCDLQPGSSASFNRCHFPSRWWVIGDKIVNLHVPYEKEVSGKQTSELFNYNKLYD